MDCLIIEPIVGIVTNEGTTVSGGTSGEVGAEFANSQARPGETWVNGGLRGGMG